MITRLNSLKEKHTLGQLAAAKARSYSPTTIASKHRPVGRPDHGSAREQPMSKYSTTIRPCPSIVSWAAANCQTRENAGSYQSRVEIRP